MAGIADIELTRPPILPTDVPELLQGNHHRVTSFLQRAGVLISCTGGPGTRLESDYQPHIWARCHPYSFPNGRNSGMRTPGMSEAYWRKHIVLRYPESQYGGQPSLLWHLADTQLRHDANSTVHFMAAASPHILQPLQHFTLEDARAAAIILAADPHSEVRRRALANAPERVRAFANTLHVATVRLDGSDAFYSRFRSEVAAVCVGMGMPNFFFTLNYSDLTASAVAYVAGQRIHFRSDTAAPTDAGQPEVRWERSARSPIGCALNAWASLKAFCEVMFGWDIEDNKRLPDAHRGPVGPVSYVLNKAEVTGRGALHSHGGSKIDALDAQRVQRAFDTAVQAMRAAAHTDEPPPSAADVRSWPPVLIQLVEALGCTTLPAPFTAPPTVAARNREPFEPAADVLPPDTPPEPLLLPRPHDPDQPASYSLDILLRNAHWPCDALPATQHALDTETTPPVPRTWPRLVSSFSGPCNQMHYKPEQRSSAPIKCMQDTLLLLHDTRNVCTYIHTYWSLTQIHRPMQLPTS